MRVVFVLILLGIMNFCSLNSESLGEYIRNPENGLVAIDDSKSEKLMLQHVPVDWIIQREIGNGIIERHEIEERKKALKMFEHYEVSVVSKEHHKIRIGQIRVVQNEKELLPAILQEEALGTDSKSKYILTIDKSQINTDLERRIKVIVGGQEYGLPITAESIKKYHQKITNNEITVE